MEWEWLFLNIFKVFYTTFSPCSCLGYLLQLFCIADGSDPMPGGYGALACTALCWLHNTHMGLFLAPHCTMGILATMQQISTEQTMA